jgi:transposase
MDMGMGSHTDFGYGVARRLDVVALGRRRRWSDAFKQQLVLECAVAGATVSGVARRHGIALNLLFEWRRRFSASRLGVSTIAGDSIDFTEVRIVDDPVAIPTPVSGSGVVARVSGRGVSVEMTAQVPLALAAALVGALAG